MAQSSPSLAEQSDTPNDDRLQTLARIARQISGRVNFSAVALNIVQAAAMLTQAKGASFMVVEEDAGRLFVREGHNIDRRFTADQQVPWGTRLIDLLTVAAHPITSTNITATEPSPFRDFAAAVGFDSYYGLPVRSGTLTAGLLNLYWADSDRQPSAAEETMLDGLAALAAMLIDRSNLDKVEEASRRKQDCFASYKREFASLVSHQMRTPLTSIKGFAQLLVRQQNTTTGGTNAARYGTTILGETNRLADLITNMTDLSQMEVAMVEMRVQVININNMINECLLDVAAINKPAVVHLNLEPNLPICEGDSQYLRALLTDLLHRFGRLGPLELTTTQLNEEGTEIAGAVAVRFLLDAALAQEAGLITDVANFHLRQAVDGSVDSDNKAIYIAKNLLEVMGGVLKAEQVGDDQGRASLHYTISLPTLRNRLASSGLAANNP